MSQKDSVKLTVGDHSYDCFKLDPWTMNEITHKILNTLGSTAGELILSLLAGREGADTDEVKKELAEAATNPKEKLGEFFQKNVNMQHLANGLREILQQLNAKDTRWLMEQLAYKTTIEGGGRLSAEWDIHFLGRPIDMYKWALAALRSQYGFLEWRIGTAQ